MHVCVSTVNCAEIACCVQQLSADNTCKHCQQNTCAGDSCLRRTEQQPSTTQTAPADKCTAAAKPLKAASCQPSGLASRKAYASEQRDRPSPSSAEPERRHAPHSTRQAQAPPASTLGTASGKRTSAAPQAPKRQKASRHQQGKNTSGAQPSGASSGDRAAAQALTKLSQMQHDSLRCAVYHCASVQEDAQWTHSTDV